MTDAENPVNQAKHAPHRRNVLVIGRDHRVAEIVAEALPDWAGTRTR